MSVIPGEQSQQQLASTPPSLFRRNTEPRITWDQENKMGLFFSNRRTEW